MAASPKATLSSTHPLIWRWIGPVPGACMLLTIIGLLYADGVFVAEIDNPVFTKAIGVAFLFCDLGLTLFSTLLHHASSDRLYRRAPPLLGLLCAALLICQALMPLALRSQNNTLLFSAATALGLACGGTYVIGLAVLQAWVPDAVAFINGVGMLFVSLGSFLGVFFFQFAVQFGGSPGRALEILAFAECAVVLFFSTLVSCPPRGWHPNWENADRNDDSSELLKPILGIVKDQNNQPAVVDASVKLPAGKGDLETGEKRNQTGLSSDVAMTLPEVMATPTLYPFTLTVVAIIGPGTGLAMSFPHMMAVLFGTESSVASSWFTWVLASGLAGRFFSGFAVETLEKYSSNCTGFFGSRTATVVFLTLQSTCLLLMPLVAHFGFERLYSALAMLIYFSFSSGMVSSICLARSMYTAFNSSVTFNIGGFLTGIVEIVYAVIIAQTNDRKGVLVDDPGAPTPGFDYFFAFSVFLSVSGALACLSLSECKKAYRKAGLESLLTSKPQKIN